MLQTGRKATRSVKNKNNFMNVIGDTFDICHEYYMRKIDYFIL